LPAVRVAGLPAVFLAGLSAACLPYFWQVFVADELKKAELFSI